MKVFVRDIKFFYCSQLLAMSSSVIVARKAETNSWAEMASAVILAMAEKSMTLSNRPSGMFTCKLVGKRVARIKEQTKIMAEQELRTLQNKGTFSVYLTEIIMIIPETEESVPPASQVKITHKYIGESRRIEI